MSFSLSLAREGDDVPREDHELDYLPFGVRTLKLRVEGSGEGKLYLRPSRLSPTAGKAFGHEDEGDPPQFIVSWGGGYEDHCELDYPGRHVVHFLVHHIGQRLGDYRLTIEAHDASGAAARLPITLTYPQMGGLPWPADQLVRSTWQADHPEIPGSCNILLSGNLVPRYLSRWWPHNRVVYAYDKQPPMVRLCYQRLVQGQNGELRVYASQPGGPEVLLAEIHGSIGYPLFDMRRIVPELYRFGPQTWLLRVWFFWLDLEISRQDLAKHWCRSGEELEQAWRGITSKQEGGTADRAWQQVHEIPDAERVDIAFDDKLHPLYAATDLHWREMWGQYWPQRPGDPLRVQIMNTRAKELASNWQELGQVVRGWSQVILTRFARNSPPFEPHREVMAELRGEGVLAADPIGMESHTPAFLNVRIQRHLTSTDVRDA